MKRFRNTFFFPWLVSLFAVFGSLFFSEVMGFTPCNLCWYQRILMYPLLILFSFGLVKQDKNIFVYSYPFVASGWIVSFYHYGLQKGLFKGTAASFCSFDGLCKAEYINLMGFITIPFLSFTAFSLLALFLIVTFKKRLNS